MARIDTVRELRRVRDDLSAHIDILEERLKEVREIESKQLALITVKTVDRNGVPIPHAHVEVFRCGYRYSSVTTHSTGHVSFRLPAGDYVLDVSAGTFTNIKKQLTVSADTTAVTEEIRLIRNEEQSRLIYIRCPCKWTLFRLEPNVPTHDKALKTLRLIQDKLRRVGRVNANSDLGAVIELIDFDNDICVRDGDGHFDHTVWISPGVSTRYRMIYQLNGKSKSIKFDIAESDATLSLNSTMEVTYGEDTE